MFLSITDFCKETGLPRPYAYKLIHSRKGEEKRLSVRTSRKGKIMIDMDVFYAMKKAGLL